MLINIYSTDFFSLSCWPTYNLPQGLKAAANIPHPALCPAQVSQNTTSNFQQKSTGVLQVKLAQPNEQCHCFWMIQEDPAAFFLYISKTLVFLIENLANSKLDTNLSAQQLISVCAFSPLSIFIYIKFSYLCFYFCHFLLLSSLHY